MNEETRLLGLLVLWLQIFIFFPMCVLATLRLSLMLMQDQGPFDVFEKLRFALGVRYNEVGTRYAQSAWGRGILCLHCVSVWAAAVVAALQAASGGLPYGLIPLAVCAYSMGAILIWRAYEQGIH
jgi:hypothetical protein